MSADPDAHRPEQRKITARILTTPGWILGTFHVPKETPFLDFLNQPGDFFTLTEVTLPGSTKPLPFFAIARAAMILIVPGGDRNISGEVPTAREARLSCLLDDGLLMGLLDLPEKTRVSDYLMRSNRFFLVRQCTIGVEPRTARATETGPGRAGSSVQAAPVVLVQSAGVVGVAEI